ncbi:hypothetical protein EC988_004850 [Linderina pennispora]|nr:hypothetical protein EC988_004850 [Linderina pennispora]
MIVVGGGLLDTALEAFSHMDDSAKPKHILHMDEARTGMEDSIFSAMVDETAGPVDDGLQPSDYSTTPAYICYSSGTTGLPKGVLLSHRNMVANAMQIQRVKQLDLERSQGSRHEIFLGLAPFCHAYGLSYVLHSSVALGGTIVIMSRYSFDGFLKAIERHRITFAYLVPPLVCALSKDPRVDDYNVSSMHTILSGGATLSPTLIEATQKRLPHVRVIQGYGMTEMSPAITMLATSHNEPASIGILMANCEAKVVDHDNNEVAAPGEPGELCFRGPNIMVGYLNNRRATEAIFDSDGFLYTGDIGYVDSKGFFFITDRKKEIIKFKGFQISPSELESILAEHPDIADAAVMPVYDDSQATEVPKGFFVMKDSGNNDQERAKAVVEWLHERVAGFKRLRGGFVIIDHIPRSPAGKIIRKSLREIQHVNLGKATAAA